MNNLSKRSVKEALFIREIYPDVDFEVILKTIQQAVPYTKNPAKAALLYLCAQNNTISVSDNDEVEYICGDTRKQNIKPNNDNFIQITDLTISEEKENINGNALPTKNNDSILVIEDEDDSEVEIVEPKAATREENIKTALKRLAFLKASSSDEELSSDDEWRKPKIIKTLEPVAGTSNTITSPEQTETLTFNNTFSFIEGVLPDIDRNFLRTKIIKLGVNSQELKLFVNKALQDQYSYPRKTNTSQRSLFNPNRNSGSIAKTTVINSFLGCSRLLRENHQTRPPPKRTRPNTAKEDVINLDTLFNSNQEPPATAYANFLKNFEKLAVPNFKDPEKLPQKSKRWFNPIRRRGAKSVGNDNNGTGKTSRKKKKSEDVLDLDELFGRRTKMDPQPLRPQNPPVKDKRISLPALKPKVFSKMKGPPKMDPDFVQQFMDKFKYNPEEYRWFMKGENAKSKIEETLRVEELQREPEFYTINFNVKDFLETIPNPEEYFSENRHTKPWSSECEEYATCALYNIYKQVNLDEIRNCLLIAPNFLAACDMIDKISNFEEKSRPEFPMPPLISNTGLLKEIAYKTHQSKILEFLKIQKDIRLKKIARAKEEGSMKSCNCCCNDEVLLEDMYQCNRGCSSCGDCIRRYLDSAMSEGRKFGCLNHCQGQYTSETLQLIFPEKYLTKIVSIHSNENLVFCPFCNSSGECNGVIFKCLNSDCLKESCKLCKGVNHVPYKCEEVEQDENIMARTYIENKMTEAVVRKCYQCGINFIKLTGCNTVTCTCGAQMCYICRKPVVDLYLHRGCQKYSVIKVDEENVMKTAEEARRQVGSILKIDPTIGITKYFNEIRNLRIRLKKQKLELISLSTTEDGKEKTTPEVNTQTNY